MRILVTGSSGFIGQPLTAELKDRGHDVVPFDRPLHDIRDSADLGVAVRVGGRVEAIINLAGMLGTPELLGAEFLAAEVNILGALNVYDVAASLGIPVVQIGTGHKGQPNPYAITKGCAEDLGLARAQWLGDKINVVRAFHVYGPGQLPGAPHGPSAVHKFFPTFACAALTGKPLRLYGGGGQLIDPIHVSLVARVLADAVGPPYGKLIEAGAGIPYSVADVAQDIWEMTGSGPSRCEISPSRAGEPRDAQVIAVNPSVQAAPWPYLVAETIDYYRDWLERWNKR